MMNVENICFFCGSVAEKNNIRQKSIDTIVAASRKRNDENWKKLEGAVSLVFHTKCRADYINAKNIQTAEKRPVKCVEGVVPSNRTAVSPVRKRLRGSFLYSTSCLICEEDADERAEVKKRMELRQEISLLTEDGKNTLLKICEGRPNDDTARSVRRRLLYNEDLEQGGKYHQRCYAKFCLPENTQKKTGRPENMEIRAAMEKIYEMIENSEDYQFSLTDMLREFDATWINHEIVKDKLLKRYGNDIIISTRPGCSYTTISLRYRSQQMLHDLWYTQRKSNERDEKIRIIQTAAELILEDASLKVYDTNSYPPSSDFLGSAKTDIPELLSVFLNHLYTRKPKKNRENTEKKCIAAAHVILSSIRPRTYLSPVQIATAIYFHRRFGSRQAIDILAKLGLSASYHEVMLFESSALQQETHQTFPDSFCQFVFDNADHNICTLDGLNTFHVMGGIKCITPKSSVIFPGKMKRLSKISSAKEMSKVNQIPLLSFERVGRNGFENYQMENVDAALILCHNTAMIPWPLLLDRMWECGKSLACNLPGWNGFLEATFQNSSYEESRIVFLPFINHNPSDYDTIYTSLSHAAQTIAKTRQVTCFVTFDLPLWKKAREILSGADVPAELKNVIPRLGGFHMLMSYMGAIGYIMSDSGLLELLSECYAPVSAKKMLTGHAYGRALRGHLLIHLAISMLVWEEVEISEVECSDVKNILSRCLKASDTITSEEKFLLRELYGRFDKRLDEIENRGANSKLWVQYYRMVGIMKHFILAERMGDWERHLHCVRKMLPIFHASGHFSYAKCAHVYLSDMLNLPNRMNAVEFDKFVKEGYFTIRRSSKFWSGLWTDLTIEQTLMNLMNQSGGMTTGRGITGSTLIKWTKNMPVACEIMTSFEHFSGLKSEETKCHVDATRARITRDTDDGGKFYKWLKKRNPFSCGSAFASLGSGIVGDEKAINCHSAFEIGEDLLRGMIGREFNKIICRRSNRVNSFASVTSAITVGTEIVPVDPDSLFQRFSARLNRKDSEDMKLYFNHELAPFPTSLFSTSVSMRKCAKAKLYAYYEPIDKELDKSNCIFVIDGGFLLRRVVWTIGQSFASIASSYINYIIRHFGHTAIVVIDGYGDTVTSTKWVEQVRRKKGVQVKDVIFDESTELTVPQDQFLSSAANKKRLIEFLQPKFELANILLKQAAADADTLIVETAIACSNIENPKLKNVAIVGQDIDLLVILRGICPPKKEVFFVKPRIQKTERQVYSSMTNEGALTDLSMLALHALSGCDTTSTLYGKGKTTWVKRAEKTEGMEDTLSRLTRPSLKRSTIIKIGEKIILSIYGASSTMKTLDELRASISIKKKNKLKLKSLPPTSDAAQFHSLRAYCQIQTWLGNITDPTKFGWEQTSQGLLPVTMSKPPAPQDLMIKIMCGCTKGCSPSSGCSCRKSGLKCSNLCNCTGESCLNMMRPEIKE